MGPDEFAARVNARDENDTRYAAVDRYLEKLEHATTRFFTGSARYGFIATPDKQLGQIKELLAQLRPEDRHLRDYVLTHLIEAVPQEPRFFHFESKNKLMRIYQRYLDPGSVEGHSVPPFVRAARQEGAPRQQIVSDASLIPMLGALTTLTGNWSENHRQGVRNIINAQLIRMETENPWGHCALLCTVNDSVRNIPQRHRHPYRVLITNACMQLYAEETRLHSAPEGASNAAQLADLTRRANFLSRHVRERPERTQ